MGQFDCVTHTRQLGASSSRRTCMATARQSSHRTGASRTALMPPGLVPDVAVLRAFAGELGLLAGDYSEDPALPIRVRAG
jgi:hypothetical protein